MTDPWRDSSPGLYLLSHTWPQCKEHPPPSSGGDAISREDPNLNPGKLILTLMCYVTFQILAQVTLYVEGDIPVPHPSASDSRQC